MTKANLRAVPRAVSEVAADEPDVGLDEGFAERAKAEIRGDAAKAKPSVRELIGTAARSLKKWLVEMRELEAGLEADKAAATAAFESTVAAAKLLLEDRHTNIDAELKQLRETMKSLEPARADLAEKVS